MSLPATLHELGRHPFPPAGDRTMVTIDGHDILVVRRGDSYFAMSNVCAHQHFSRLHQGRCEEWVVECPMHGWQYDIRTGRAVSGNGTLPTYPVDVRNGVVVLQFSLPDEPWMR